MNAQPDAANDTGPAHLFGVAAPLLWLLLLVGLPFGKLSEVPLALASLCGCLLIWQRRAGIGSDPRWKLGLSLFACYWLPVLASAIDAVEPAKTWSTAGAILRFLPALLLIIAVLPQAALRRDRLVYAASVVIALWTLDALAQAVFGVDLRGASSADRVSGLFGDDNLKLGPVLAVLSPLPLECVMRKYGRRWALFAWMLLAAAVLVAGARAGWICFGLVSGLLAWRHARHRREFAIGTVALLGIALLGTLFAYRVSDRVAARVDRSLSFLSGDEAGVDRTLSMRLPIWRTAAAMAWAHPVNGVGARGFRYAYAQYASADDPWVDLQRGVGAAHPHQLVLELLAETGVIGVIAWGYGLLLLRRAWRAATAAARERAVAPALALIAMCFPLNTHYAFYSSYWALLLWWLIALLCAALVETTESAHDA